MTTPTTPASASSTLAPTSERAAVPGASPGRRNIGRVLAIMCIAACGLWAFMPLGPANVNVPEVGVTAAAGTGPTRSSLDLAAFNAPLWVAPAPPSPVVVEAPPAPPPPLKWQLLAIVREDAGYRALVYDPDADRLLVLREGDESGSQRVEHVTATTLDVRDGGVGGAGVRTLALREGMSGGRP
jgi:hypothetical protein